MPARAVNVGIDPNAQFNKGAVASSRMPASGRGKPVLDGVPYTSLACTAIAKTTGLRCTNKLRSAGEKSHGLCFGHMRHTGSE